MRRKHALDLYRIGFQSQVIAETAESLGIDEGHVHSILGGIMVVANKLGDGTHEYPDVELWRVVDTYDEEGIDEAFKLMVWDTEIEYDSPKELEYYMNTLTNLYRQLKWIVDGLEMESLMTDLKWYDDSCWEFDSNVEMGKRALVDLFEIITTMRIEHFRLIERGEGD